MKQKIERDQQMKNIVFFDGVCNFCNAWVQFLLKHDRGKFYFAPLQGDTAKIYLPLEDRTQLSSLVLYQNGILYRASDAVLAILKELPAPWSLVIIFSVIPKWIRDRIYLGFAKIRHRVFRKNICVLPEPAEKHRLLK